ncbi:unnamed protein product, partial [Prorocentrum cordatum]
MAWKRTPMASEILLNATIGIMKGCPVPLDFNESLLVFTPKGSEPEDSQTVSRLAKAYHAQKGFLPQRRFIERVAMVGAQSRIAAMKPR